ncbi:MAG: hypothetical protein J6Y64_05030, partial [Ruminococcus sp.]|nr:hypothetical protein [Ruminococcus sp.]
MSCQTEVIGKVYPLCCYVGILADEEIQQQEYCKQQQRQQKKSVAYHVIVVFHLSCAVPFKEACQQPYCPAASPPGCAFFELPFELYCCFFCFYTAEENEISDDTEHEYYAHDAQHAYCKYFCHCISAPLFCKRIFVAVLAVPVSKHFDGFHLFDTDIIGQLLVRPVVVDIEMLDAKKSLFVFVAVIGNRRDALVHKDRISYAIRRETIKAAYRNSQYD